MTRGICAHHTFCGMCCDLALQEHLSNDSVTLFGGKVVDIEAAVFLTWTPSGSQNWPCCSSRGGADCHPFSAYILGHSPNGVNGAKLTRRVL